MEYSKLLDLASDLGYSLAMSGAETFRVEESVTRILAAYDIEAEVFVAGAALKDGQLVTNGGRVLGVTATADTLAEAVSKAYAGVEKVHFDKAHYRRDIGRRALEG